MERLPQVVVVTGASAGVGRATAVAFARRGAKVALLARGHEGLEGAAKEVERAGGDPLPIPTDVADAEAVEAAAGLAEDRLGPVDVWVNDAMVTLFAPLGEMTAAEFARATEVTYLGTVHGTMAALRRMRPRGRGAIVQVGSALSYRAIPLQSAYCGAKFAIRGFTDSVRTELEHERSGIRVTMVQLPALNTPQFDWCRTRMPGRAMPVPPIYQPEVAAEAIHWAAHHRRREVWVGGSTVATILANKVLPAALDRYLARTGYRAQQEDRPVAPERPDNLGAPVDEHVDAGAHGRFDDRAHPRSVQVWMTERRPWVMGGAIAAAAAVVLTRRR
jgi:NAD(P)-dependent dehydrogenase (short-subunit alcohol dehydrogenase family)